MVAVFLPTPLVLCVRYGGNGRIAVVCGRLAWYSCVCVLALYLFLSTVCVFCRTNIPAVEISIYSMDVVAAGP